MPAQADKRKFGMIPPMRRTKVLLIIRRIAPPITVPERGRVPPIEPARYGVSEVRLISTSSVSLALRSPRSGRLEGRPRVTSRWFYGTGPLIIRPGRPDADLGRPRPAGKLTPRLCHGQKERFPLAIVRFAGQSQALVCHLVVVVAFGHLSCPKLQLKGHNAIASQRFQRKLRLRDSERAFVKIVDQSLRDSRPRELCRAPCLWLGACRRMATVCYG